MMLRKFWDPEESSSTTPPSICGIRFCMHGVNKVMQCNSVNMIQSSGDDIVHSSCIGSVDQ